MFPLQNTGSVNVLKQASTATNASATGLVDTLGFDECKVQVFLDSAAATSSNPSVLKLQEADTSDGSFADITGFEGDATDGFTVPVAVTEAPQQTVDLNVDCRARKRWLKCIVTPAGAAQIVGITAVLGKADDSTLAQAKPDAVANG